jgi:hypothetical protein
VERDGGRVIDPEHALLSGCAAELREEAAGGSRFLGGADLGQVLAADAGRRIVAGGDADQDGRFPERLTFRVEQEDCGILLVDDRIGQGMILP